MFSVTRMEASCISRAWPASDSATVLVVAMARLTLSSEREARCETAIPESIESDDVRIAWAAAMVSRLMSLKILEISLVAIELRSASLRTSSATTAKPRPC